MEENSNEIHVRLDVGRARWIDPAVVHVQPPALTAGLFLEHGWRGLGSNPCSVNADITSWAAAVRSQEAVESPQITPDDIIADLRVSEKHASVRDLKRFSSTRPYVLSPGVGR